MLVILHAVGRRPGEFFDLNFEQFYFLNGFRAGNPGLFFLEVDQKEKFAKKVPLLCKAQQKIRRASGQRRVR